MSDPRTKRFDADAAARMAERIGRKVPRWRDVTWPGGTMRVRLYAPNTEDKQLATAAALDRLRAVGMPLVAITADELRDEITVQTLAICIQDPNVPLDGEAGRQGRCEPLMDADMLRATVDAYERGAFVDELNDLITSVDPELGELTETDFDLVADAVKKKDATLLRSFGSRTLTLYMLSSAARP